MFRIGKTFKFSASHVLEGLPAGHQCGRLHGHNYTVEIIITGFDSALTEEGWLKDFGDLKPIKEYIDATFDHRHLNDIVTYQPTSELLANHLFGEFKALLHLEGKNAIWVERVRISETDSTWAEYFE